MRNTQLADNLAYRIEKLDLSAADKRIAIENALRAERIGDLIEGAGRALRRFAEYALVKPARFGAALWSRLAH
jgi:hypothetical protein